MSQLTSRPQTILITGASTGFGYGAAKALAQSGHTVFATMRGVADKNAEKASDLRRWAASTGAKLQVVELDVTSDTSVKTAVDVVVASAGRVDVLVNNAGVGAMGLHDAFTVEQVNALFAVNVYGALRMNRAVIPHMQHAGAGYIIYVTSSLGRLVAPFMGPYAASKHALEALAEAASYELELLGIGTTIVEPGGYATNFFTNSIHAADQGLIDTRPAVKAIREKFSKRMEDRAKSGQIGNPNELSELLVGLVEMDKDKRPLRRAVGADAHQPVTAINERVAEIQTRVLAAFGLR
jgi:NAD(P)-dependent dehydrogenase (short-subunit alcohol dehydrogenase family)